jgi:hypothetical protein
MMLALAPRWERTVITQRDAIAKLLTGSPSLRRQVAAMIAGELPTARRATARSVHALVAYRDRLFATGGKAISCQRKPSPKV